MLIVADNTRLRVRMREIVAKESAHHVVGEAADGAEAMRMPQEFWLDIMLLDRVMPRVNGLEVLWWSRHRDPRSWS
jgi:two-component system chemotaxis response regulator CheY